MIQTLLRSGELQAALNSSTHSAARPGPIAAPAGEHQADEQTCPNGEPHQWKHAYADTYRCIECSEEVKVDHE